AADQIQDIATVVSWARSQPDVREISLVGLGLAGPQVLLARPLIGGLARTAVDLGARDDRGGSGPPPPPLHPPRIYQFGGLKVAPALTAPDPIRIYRAGRTFARAWPQGAYALQAAADALEFPEGDPRPDALARWIDRDE